MKIKHISLDFWNTLGIPNKDYSDRRMQILSDYSVSHTVMSGSHTHAPEYCHKAYKEVKKRIDDMTAYGQYSSLDECFTMLCDWLEMDNPPHHLVTEMKAKLWRAFFDNPPKISLNTIEVMEKLKRKGITFSIGSNTNFIPGIVLRNAVLDKLDLFDYMVFSDEVGVSKPVNKFFQIINKKCWDSFGHCGDSIVHIGDSEVFDLLPAKQFGINAELVSDPFALPELLEQYL